MREPRSQCFIAALEREKGAFLGDTKDACSGFERIIKADQRGDPCHSPPGSVPYVGQTLSSCLCGRLLSSVVVGRILTTFTPRLASSVNVANIM